MKRPLQLALCLILLSTSAAQAVITTTGNVEPGDPSSWDDSTIAYVAKDCNGTLAVDGGSEIFSQEGYLGYSFGTTGTVNISGAGSKWSNHRDLTSISYIGTATSNLYVGREGTGQLNITDGGVVSSGGGSIGYASGSSGTVNVFGSESVWEYHQSIGGISIGEDPIILDSIPSSSNTSLVQATPLTQDVFSQSGFISAIPAFPISDRINLYVGQEGSGQLKITDGGKAISSGGYVGYASGAFGKVTVSGSGTIWNAGFESTLENTVAQAGLGSGINIQFGNSPKIYVGENGTGQLNIADGGTVNSQGSSIGYASGSMGIVTISGADSTWRNTSILSVSGTPIYIGEEGAGQLDITDGGIVSSYGGMIGNKAGSIGTVTVSGNGSAWESYSEQTLAGGSIGVGVEGVGRMNITDTGTVTSRGGYLGSASGATGSVLVSGSGSTWTIGSDRWGIDNNLQVGRAGTGQLTINDGGTVKSSGCDIGYQVGSVGTVTVSGSGSKWINEPGETLFSDNGNLYVGREGTGQLNITDGAMASSSQSYIGYGSESTGTVNVSGVDSTGANVASSYLVNGSLYVGYGGTGTLNITDGGTVNSMHCSIGCMAGSTGIVNVSGAGSTWTNIDSSDNSTSYFGNLSVGTRGTGILNITNGGTVLSEGGSIGYIEGSTGIVTVAGSGSVWINREDTDNLTEEYHSDLYVGYSGKGTLNIIDGGTVEVFGETCLGTNKGEIHFDSGTLNTAGLMMEPSDLTGTGTINTNGLVSDIDLHFNTPGGSSQTITLDSEPDQNITINLEQSAVGNLGVGYRGNASLIIENGATVASHSGYLGYHPGSYGTATLSGSGSTWTNSEEIYIGGREGSGQLEIKNGATLSSRYFILAFGDNSTGKVTVSGNGSTLTNSDGIIIGLNGTGQLDILDGAKVHAGHVHLGGNPDSTGTVTVSGEGSALASNSDLLITTSGTGSLSILDGGTVGVAGQTWVGRYDRQGSLHFDDGTLTTGGLISAISTLTGTGTINTNGLVSDVDLRFDATNGPNKTIILVGPSEQYITIHLNQTADGDLGVGHTNRANLTIKDAMTVECKDGYLALSDGSSATATISGTGTQWICHDRLFVGHEGTARMDITDGAVVTDRNGIIGRDTSSIGTVTVDGNGSKWINNNELSVGKYGTGQLNIINGGTVLSGSGEIGCFRDTTGTVTVSGTGSNWTNDGYLDLGYHGCTGSLIITDGGLVTSRRCIIGGALESTGIVSVSGIASKWINEEAIYVGDEGTGILNITNGGTVSSGEAYIRNYQDPRTIATVSGRGSTWTNNGDFHVGSDRWYEGACELNIADGGLVSVTGTLRIYESEEAESFINISTGGMLALAGEADESLDAFFDLIDGTDAIRWWDDSIGDWAPLTAATMGEDYTLEYQPGRVGYTILTVGVVPEPGGVVLVLTGFLAVGLVPAIRTFSSRNRQ